MEFGRVWVLRGLNLWANIPVIEAEIDLGQQDSYRPLQEGSPLLRVLRDWPGPLDNVHLDPQANLAEVLLILTQAWQQLIAPEGAARDRSLEGRVHVTNRPAFYRIIFSYDEEALGQACLQAAYALCQAALAGESFDLARKRKELRELANEVRLGPSTRSIFEAAIRRGIPARRLNAGSLVQLGWGCRQKRIWTAETDNTPAIAEIVAQDKQLTRALLDSVGVPVPFGRPVVDREDAWKAAEQIGLPVVVKPQFGNQGRGVATNLSTREQVLNAFDASWAISPFLVVEKHVSGADYRLLVIGGQLAAAALREPAHVVGDGRSTISQLIDKVNEDPRRSDGHATSLSWIKLDAIGLAVLAEQGFSPDAIPPPGSKVLIRRNANLSTGGTATDITEQVHPAVAAHAVDAARIVGLDIAGVDIVAEDIRQPLDSQGGVIVEVNAGPGLRMHLEPSAGSPRDVGGAIVDSLFPTRMTGRVPIVAVTGTNGKTTTTRMIAHLMRKANRYTGMTCTDGIYLDGRRTETRDCSGPQSARQVLLNPRVEVAVLETARGGILREGLGFDRCDVGIVTNIGKGDHLGLRGIGTLEELTKVKEVLVRAVAVNGYAILNAADPLVVGMARACPGKVLFFARDESNSVLQAHRATGGRAAFPRNNEIILATGTQENTLISLEEVPLTQGGKVPFQVDNVVASAAAAWCLGLAPEVICSGLRTFTGRCEELPGRFNVLPVGDAVVIVDYAHNPSAVSALIEGLQAFTQPHRTLVFTGCNRRDIDLLDMGEQVGQAFDRIILYADRGHSGRDDGELNTILRQGLARGGRVTEVAEVNSEREAVELALRSLQNGEVLVIGVESIEESLDFIQHHLRSQKRDA